MKKKLLAIALSGSLALPAFAADNLQGSDVDFIFDNAPSASVELSALSPAEMKATEGAWVPQAVGALTGALGGHWGYMSGAAFGKNYSFTSHMAAIGVGGVGGVFNPVRAISTAAYNVGFGTVTGGLSGWAGSQSPTISWP